MAKQLKIACVITAAGTGSRFGNRNGKQFITLNRKPMIRHSIERCLSRNEISELIITIESENKKQLQKLIAKIKTTTPIKIVIGGATRTDSVRNALQAITTKPDRVMVHDGARPNITPALLDRLIQAASVSKAVIPVVPVIDTIKRVKNSHVIETVPRQELVAVQTPQVFDYEVIKRAYKLNTGAATDDAGLVEQLGITVTTISGDRNNIKLTYPEDVAQLKRFLI